MHQDIWVEVIQFLEPIDLLTSLLTLNHKVYEFICQATCLEFDDICKFCNGDANLLGGVKISYHHDDNQLIDDNRVKVIGNTKYIIRLYLLKLAKRMGNIYPDVKFEKEIATILDSNELKLLNFYRSLLFPEFKHQEKMLYYLFTGDSRIGKTTLHHWICLGRKPNFHGGGAPIVIASKRFQIAANEICCKHLIWDTEGQERFTNRNVLITRNTKQVKTGYLLCFSMLNQETFNSLDESFKAIQQVKSRNVSNLGIIIGLYPQNNNNTTNKVNVKSAIMKSYSLGKSVFVESNCVEEKQMYACFWFLQLQFSYFHNFKELTYSIDKIQPNNESTTSNSWCSLQ